MINIPNKNNNDPTTLEYAEEFNSIKNELMNTVTSTGQSLESSPGLNTQVGSSLAYYAASGQFYQSGGANVNNYVATVVGQYKGVLSYLIGMRFRVSIGQTNTGICTLQINGLGALSIKKKSYTGAIIDLEAGDLIGGNTIVVDYTQGSPNYFLLIDNGVQRIEQTNVEAFTYVNSALSFPVPTGVGVTTGVPLNTPLFESRAGMYNVGSNYFSVVYSGVYVISAGLSVYRQATIAANNNSTVATLNLTKNGAAIAISICNNDHGLFNLTAGEKYSYGTASLSICAYLNVGDLISAVLTSTTQGGAPFFIQFSSNATYLAMNKIQ